MLEARRLRFDAKLVVDYLSEQGPRVRSVRGIAVHGALTQLRHAGHIDDYLARLPTMHHGTLLEALASTWVPVEALVAHFATLDGMLIGGAPLARLAEPASASLFTSLFSTLLRASRAVGADRGMWTFLNQGDRVWSRIYDGGGCKVVQVGPKDATVEIVGLPYASSPSFRTMACGALRSLIAMTTARAGVVKIIATREAQADRLRFSIGWV